MENKHDKLAAELCCGFTALLAVTLAVNGIQALMGQTQFAWWHLATLAFMVTISKAQLAETPELVYSFKRALTGARIWLRRHSRTFTRAVAAAALFNRKLTLKGSRP